MNLRATMLKARIAKLQKELAEEEHKEADGASMVRACGDMTAECGKKAECGEKTEAPAEVKTAEEDKLPEPPAEIKATAQRTSVRAAMERAIQRRAARKEMERKAGAEDKINQKYLTDVEGITHTPSGVLPSIRKLRAASASLDRIADQLERQGKVALAYRVDRVADEIDARIAKYEKKIVK